MPSKDEWGGVEVAELEDEFGGVAVDEGDEFGGVPVEEEVAAETPPYQSPAAGVFNIPPLPIGQAPLPQMDPSGMAFTPRDGGGFNFEGGRPPEESLLGTAKEAIMSPLDIAGRFVNAAASDVGATLGTAAAGRLDLAGEQGGNLLEFFKSPLEQQGPTPQQKVLADISASNPVLATTGKIAGGVVSSLPLIALMPQGAVGKLIAAGFTADMISHAPDAARRLGEEMGKPESERNMDNLTTAISDLAQTAAFAPLAGAHAGGKVIGERVAPRAEAIRELANQLKREPLDRPATTPQAQRQLGVRIPEGENVLATPELQALADRALQQGPNPPLDRGDVSALERIRQELNPPRLETVEPTRVAERIEGGGEAPFGKVSYQRQANPFFDRASESEGLGRASTPPTVESIRAQRAAESGQRFIRSTSRPTTEAAPTMDFARRVSEMTPDEFFNNATGFNRVNLELGRKATTADIAELTQLRDRAMKDWVDYMGNLERRRSAGEVISEAEMNQLQLIGGKPQFFNEAIAEANASKAAQSKPLTGPEISEILGADFRGEAGKGGTLLQFEAKKPDGTPSTSFSVKKGATREEVLAKYQEVMDRYKDDPQNAPRGLPETAEPTLESTPLDPQSGRSISETQGFLDRANIWADEVLNRDPRLQTRSGLDPAQEATRVAAITIKGAVLIRDGITNFKEWSQRMIEQYGEGIRGQLNDLWEKANNYAKSTQSSAAVPSSQRPIQIGAPAAPTSSAKPQLGNAQAGGNNRGQPQLPNRGNQNTQNATLDDIYKIFEPEKKVSPTLKERGVQIAEAFRTGVSSKFRPVNKLAQDIAKAYGQTSSKDIAGIMEQLKGSQGKGEADVYRFDRDVSKLVEGSEKDFNAYMFLQRTLDRLNQDAADVAAGGKPRRSVSNYTVNDIGSKIRALEAKVGPDKLRAMENAAREYQRYMDDALKLQVESGRMSQAVYNEIKAGNQFYAPFKVMKYLEESSKPAGSGKRIDTTADFTKAMEGIEDPNFKLGDMLGAARQGILMSRILADKNTAMRNVSELAAFDTQGKFIKKLAPTADAPRGFEAVNVFENGKQNRYAVRPEVAEAIQLYGGNAGGVISRALGYSSIPFRAGATALNIPFQVGNLLIADAPRAALVSKYGVRGASDLIRYPLDFAQAFMASIQGNSFGRKNKLYLDFLDSGVAGATVQEFLTPEALKFKEPTNISKSKKLANTVINTIPRFAKAIEETNKILGVKRAIRFEGVTDGKQLAKQVPEAITELRRFSGSPDFGRQGKWVEQARLNLLYMFLNARIQGAVADVGRLAGRDSGATAAQTWLKIGSAVAIPTAYLYYLNQRPEFKEDYENRPEQEKRNYWLIPKDTFITNDDGEKMRDYWRIPKREISKWMANMTETALGFAQNRDPEAAKEFGVSMIEEISPVNITGDTAQERLESVAASLNPLLKAPLELASGRDLYRHRNIVPESMKDASPEEQYTPRTSEAFKKLAVLMPDVMPEVLRSPLILESLTRNLTAGMFTQFIPRKPVEGRSALENNPLLARFQALPYTDNTQIQKEIDDLRRVAADEQLERHRAAVKLIDENKSLELGDIVAKAPEDERLVRHLVDLWVAKQNGITAQERQILALPVRQRASYVNNQLRGLNPQQKEERIMDLGRKRILTEAVFQEMGEMQ